MYALRQWQWTLLLYLHILSVIESSWASRTSTASKTRHNHGALQQLQYETKIVAFENANGGFTTELYSTAIYLLIIILFLSFPLLIKVSCNMLLVYTIA